LKIAKAGQLEHEYNVYMNIAGSIGTLSVIWYGREDVYEVIILEYLGNSLGDLINEKLFNHRRVFSFALQMVCLLYL